MSFTSYQPILEQVAFAAKTLTQEVYLVGGIIRDSLLNIADLQSDLDFTIAGDASLLAAQIAEKSAGQLRLFPEFRSAKVLFGESWHGVQELDFVSTRQESYSRPGSLPTVKPGSLTDDLARRDFSINTLAVNLSDVLTILTNYSVSSGSSATYCSEKLRSVVIDKHTGIQDLEKRILRILHQRSFVDDPTRIFRAARYLTRIAGTLDSFTHNALQQALQDDALKTISQQRAEREMLIVFSERESKSVVKQLAEWGVFQALGWLKDQELHQFFAYWNKIDFKSEVAANVLLEYFKLTCVMLDVNSIDQQRADALLVAPKKLKAWRRNLKLLEQGKQKDISDLFLTWAVTVNKFPEMNNNLAQIMAERGLQ